jgi:transcriptional regulator with XRE-family HTH domain
MKTLDLYLNEQLKNEEFRKEWEENQPEMDIIRAMADARISQNLTQKELAAALHVSDRAVSKWERGAGFPDISLLEPLADALGLGVLDLLRGERGTVPEPEPTIRQALAFLARQAKERTRRKWSQVLGGTCALLMAGFVLFAILDRAGVFLQEISLEVPATVYSAEGVSAGETTVAIDGSVKILGDRSFEGQFAIHEVETTYREGVHANIRWDAMWTGAQDILFYRAGEFCTLGVERMLYITENMQSFGLRLEDGTIITTDEAYVPLLMSGYYYSIRPIFSNQF